MNSSMDWRGHFEAGEKFLQTALNGRLKKSVFTNELIFQITLLAIENLLVGIWQYHGRMPTDHTMSGLAGGLEDFCPMDGDLSAAIMELELDENMCALVPTTPTVFDEDKISRVTAIGRQVFQFAQSRLTNATGKMVRMKQTLFV